MRARPVLLLLALAGLTPACRPASFGMDRQPRVDPYEPSRFFPDGGSARHLPRGVVPRAAAHDAHAPRLAADEDGAASGGDATVDAALLARGRERYELWCSPCHGVTGRGDGTVARRGFPRPPAFGTERLRRAPDAHLYRVLRDGLGKMPAYGPHVPPADRRAIVAWVRVLQRSQHADLDDAPADARARLLAAEEPR